MTLRGDNCKWQRLMDAPYDRWQAHNKRVEDLYRAESIDLDEYRRRRWDKRDMLLNACDPIERVAVILGNLNYQVENGGFAQWVDNLYAIAAWDFLPEMLAEMGPASEKVRKMCMQIMEYVDEDTGRFRESEDDYEWESEIMPLSDRLSDEFYGLQAEWHEEVYAYLDKVGAEYGKRQTVEVG